MAGGESSTAADAKPALQPALESGFEDEERSARTLEQRLHRQRGPQPRPYTGRSAPVTAAACSEARKPITAAIASGCTQREKSAFGMSARLRGVSMVPGSTALTVIPRSFSSAARLSVSLWTPALDAV